MGYQKVNFQCLRCGAPMSVSSIKSGDYQGTEYCKNCKAQWYIYSSAGVIKKQEFKGYKSDYDPAKSAWAELGNTIIETARSYENMKAAKAQLEQAKAAAAEEERKRKAEEWRIKENALYQEENEKAKNAGFASVEDKNKSETDAELLSAVKKYGFDSYEDMCKYLGVNPEEKYYTAGSSYDKNKIDPRMEAGFRYLDFEQLYKTQLEKRLEGLEGVYLENKKKENTLFEKEISDDDGHKFIPEFVITVLLIFLSLFKLRFVFFDVGYMCDFFDINCFKIYWAAKKSTRRLYNKN